VRKSFAADVLEFDVLEFDVLEFDVLEFELCACSVAEGSNTAVATATAIDASDRA
jgi:hypothetical protein